MAGLFNNSTYQMKAEVWQGSHIETGIEDNSWQAKYAAD